MGGQRGYLYVHAGRAGGRPRSHSHGARPKARRRQRSGKSNQIKSTGRCFSFDNCAASNQSMLGPGRAKRSKKAQGGAGGLAGNSLAPTSPASSTTPSIHVVSSLRAIRRQARRLWLVGLERTNMEYSSPIRSIKRCTYSGAVARVIAI